MQYHSSHSDDKWSMDRILLHLTIPKTLSNNDRLFVVGSIKELGMFWNI